MKHILIIGSGIAGMTAAIKCAEEGNFVTLVSKMRSERSQSVMAMGGINAALNTKGENDSPKNHFEDTMKGGCYINDEKAVRKLTEDAPKLVKWLGDLGVSFTRDEKGQIDLRHFGGQKKMRTAYAGARTGKQIVTGLNALCRKYEAQEKVERRTGYSLISLIITEDKECLGAIFTDDKGEFVPITADAVILACGGPNKLFGKTTGSILNDGSCQGIALSQGVELGNLEMIQYHPTTVETKVKNMLITEACRGEGGKLYTFKDGEKWFFMDEWYPGVGELMPRDVVSRSIFKVCNLMKLGIDGENKVYLDISMLPKEVIDKKLDETVEVCRDYLNLDVHTTPIPVYPGIHYFMGGIKTDENHKTNLKRLYAAGECSCQYHGANRLGGNSLLGAVHGGFVAAENIKDIAAADGIAKNGEMALALKAEKDKEEAWNNRKIDDYIYVWKVEEMLAHIMKNAMGIVRKECMLANSYKCMESLKEDCEKLKCDYTKYKALSSAVFLAEAMIKSAYERKETRGAHVRIDYPDTLDKYKKCTSVIYKNNEFIVEFKGTSKGADIIG